MQMWRDEVRRVVACPYPAELTSKPVRRPRVPRPVPRFLSHPTVIAAIIGLVGTLLTVIVSVISTNRGEPAKVVQADGPQLKIVTQSDEPVPQADRSVVKTVPPKSNDLSRVKQADKPKVKSDPKTLTLDDILDALGRQHQRATFGAVAGVLGSDPQSLFKGYVRSPKTAWVVNKQTGLPTGTKESEYPPGLLQNERVIDSPQDLRAWLQEHQ